MIVNNANLTATSFNRLQQRQLSDDKIIDFQSLLNEATEDMQFKGLTAKETLLQMNTDELQLLQQANALGGSIKVNALSDEGAINLLRQPDGSDRVDLNNDGLVEIGAAKAIMYPPVNAPDFVKDAWEQATAPMNNGDKMTMQLHMHIATHGIRIDGMPSQSFPSPDEQWSKQGIDDLLAHLRAGLEFEKNHFGLSENLKMQEQLYNRFEIALNDSNHQ